MTLLQLPDGFAETQAKRRQDFFQKLTPLLGTQVRFRGHTEPGPFRSGYLLEAQGDTVTFTNGISDVMSRQDFTYPCHEVLIALP